VSQGDTAEGRISRADLADVCTQLLFLPDARRETFEVIARRRGRRRASHPPSPPWYPTPMRAPSSRRHRSADSGRRSWPSVRRLPGTATRALRRAYDEGRLATPGRSTPPDLCFGARGGVVVTLGRSVLCHTRSRHLHGS
jgi:hypothetical protein